VPSRQTSERADPDREAALEAPTRGQAGTVECLIGLQRSIGNRRTAVLVGGMQPRAISRYKILGPWNKGQAVHETLTLLAVKKAKERLEAAKEAPGDLLKDFNAAAVPDTNAKFGYDPVNADASHAQFIRGVVWADDPEGLLFDKDEDTSDYSSGLMWYSHFSAGEKGDFSTLTARSHFGDLQFFHGMASKDTEAPATTKQHMLDWGRFLIDVAAGRTPTDSKVEDVPAIKAQFPNDQKRTIKELFGFAKATDIQARQRAVGALFHMVQDSFAHGHVDRDAFKLASSTKPAGPGTGLTKPPPVKIDPQYTRPTRGRFRSPRRRARGAWCSRSPRAARRTAAGSRGRRPSCRCRRGGCRRRAGGRPSRR
jgi:hypothetical protein